MFYSLKQWYPWYQLDIERTCSAYVEIFAQNNAVFWVFHYIFRGLMQTRMESWAEQNSNDWWRVENDHQPSSKLIIIFHQKWSSALVIKTDQHSLKVISIHQNRLLSFIKNYQHSLKVISSPRQNWSTFIKSDHYSLNYISLFNQTVILFWLIRSKAMPSKVTKPDKGNEAICI